MSVTVTAISPTAPVGGGEPELWIGSRGPAVKLVQRLLHIPADGIYGDQTEDRVEKFQSQHGLQVDGIVGPHTWAALLSHRTSGTHKPDGMPTPPRSSGHGTTPPTGGTRKPDGMPTPADRPPPSAPPPPSKLPVQWDKIDDTSDRNLSPKLRAMIRQEDAMNQGGLFSSNFGVPVGDQTFLNGEAHAIDYATYGPPGQRSQNPQNPMNWNTRDDLLQYVEGKNGFGQGQSADQRLHNLLSVLGPDKSYAFLSSMQYSPQYDRNSTFNQIQQSLNHLVESGDFTSDDASALVAAQFDFSKANPGYAHPSSPTVNDLITGLPSDQAGSEVRAGYATTSVALGNLLNNDITHGGLPNGTTDQAIRDRNEMYEQASLVLAGAKGCDQTKRQVFEQLLSSMNSLGGGNAASEKNVIAAEAAKILGSLDDKSQLPQELSKLGAIGPDGTIDPSSKLGQFLSAALAGQAHWGFGVDFGAQSTSPYPTSLDGVASLFKGISESGDTKLMAATLDATAQYMIQNPGDAQVLAAQDTAADGDGFRNALTSMLDKGFNDFIGLGSNGVHSSLHQQTIDDLQALCGVALGPPFATDAAKNFASMLGSHAAPFAAYALGGDGSPDSVKDPLTQFFSGVGQHRKREAAAAIFGEIMGCFSAGYDSEQNQLMKIAGSAKGYQYNNNVADAFLTTFKLVVGFVPGGGDLITAADAGLSATKIWKAAGPDNTSDQQAAQSATNQLLKEEDQNGNPAASQWMSNISKKLSDELLNLPGDDGFDIGQSYQTGSSYSTAQPFDYAVKSFFSNYDPAGYYKDQTGKDVPVG